MKAAVYYETGGPQVFKYEDVPDPSCGPRDIVIDIKAISIEGGDVLNRAGGPMPAVPHIVGYDAAGVICQVGEKVTNRHIGQRVTTLSPFGSHAEKRALAAITSWIIPDKVSFEEAACVPVTFGTAHDCLFEFGRLKAGETVLIQAGAGGVGMAAIQLAKRAGARVLATASSDKRLERLKAYGLDVGINYAEKDLVSEVRRLTENQGVDLAVDGVGGKVLQKSIEAARSRGRIITFGQAGRGSWRIDVSGLALGNKTLTGVYLGAEIATERAQKMIGQLLMDIAAGIIQVPIDRKFLLSRAAEAHAYIESRQAVGRVLLIP
ncbi:MAG: NADP-dependent oxidoreductase [Deltaproteobacteria bacterium RBG_13_43_22]|nr:MAG: NADP-dependent oxidoreductase [Deltaproteobacteria bacterium RBG_13_43_22]